MSKPTHAPKVIKVSVLAVPTISVSPNGATFTGNLGTWSGKPMTFTQRWLRDGSPIPDAIGLTYDRQEADKGHALEFEVTAHNAVGETIVTSTPFNVPADPPDPTDPTLYPGIIAAGLEAVWARKQTAGLKVTLDKTLPAHAALLPAGAVLGSFNPTSDFYVKFTQGASISGWDFTGYEVIADAAAVTVTNCRLAYPGGGRLCHPMNGGSLHLISGDLDGTGVRDVNHAMTENDDNCTLILEDVHGWNAPSIYCDNFGDLQVINSYFEAYGTNTAAINHGEVFKTDLGSFTLHGTVIDLSEGGPILCGNTGAFFLKADKTGNISGSILNSIITFDPAKPLGWTIQMGTNLPNVVHVEIGGCAIRRGNSGYIAWDDTIEVVDLGGNFDLVTGDPIDLSHP